MDPGPPAGHQRQPPPKAPLVLGLLLWLAMLALTVSGTIPAVVAVPVMVAVAVGEVVVIDRARRRSRASRRP